MADYLRENNLPASIKHGADPALTGLPWEGPRRSNARAALAEGDDQVSLSHAAAGVAETGTLILTSGAGPDHLNFLPETHIVVLERGTVVGAYEEAWDMVRETHGTGKLPRTVNMISGPSRTGRCGADHPARRPWSPAAAYRDRRHGLTCRFRTG